MHLNLPRLLLLFGLLLGLAGCSRLQPIQNIDQPLDAATQLDTRAMQQALSRALTRAHWQIETTSPGQLLVSQNFRNRHLIRVTIDYSPRRYAIRYHSSENLGYKDGQIHKRYNALVKRLQRTIDQELRNAQNLNAIGL